MEFDTLTSAVLKTAAPKSVAMQFLIVVLSSDTVPTENTAPPFIALFLSKAQKEHVPESKYSAPPLTASFWSNVQLTNDRLFPAAAPPYLAAVFDRNVAALTSVASDDET